jgi:hypothetical protein
MYRTAKLLVVLLLTSVCNNLYASQPKLSKLSGQSGHQVNLLLLNNQWSTSSNDSIDSYVKNAPGLITLINERCVSTDEKLAPELIPIAISVGKLLFDSYMDAKVAKDNELKSAAQASYSGRAILSDTQVRAAKCALIIRHDIKKKALGLLALVKLDNRSNNAFVMTPLYVAAKNAVAITKEDKDKNSAPVINISIAVLTKSIGKQPSGVSVLLPVGEGVASIPNISIGTSDKPYTCDLNQVCSSSDLVVYPSGNPVSVTFSVTETGNVGFDIDQNIAELKAIKEAIGPALVDAMKEQLK